LPASTGAARRKVNCEPTRGRRGGTCEPALRPRGRRPRRLRPRRSRRRTARVLGVRRLGAWRRPWAHRRCRSCCVQCAPLDGLGEGV